MAALDDLWRPARRDVKKLKEELAVLTAGTPVSAKFESPRYGLYIIEAEVRQSSGGELSVAGVSLGTGRAPSSALLSLAEPGAAPDVDATASVPEHGTVVSASFENPGHGRFVITGVAVDAPALGNVTLGPWFVDHPVRVGIEVLAAPGAHSVPVPSAIVALDDVATGIA